MADLFAKFSPDQPRDARGRWAPVGGFAGRRPSRWQIREALMGHGSAYGHERAIVQVRETGRVDFDREGTKNSVPMRSAFRGVKPAVRRLRGHSIVVFHNHPSTSSGVGSNPSSADIGIAIQQGGRHVVYTSTGSIYHYRSNLPFMPGSPEARAAGVVPGILQGISLLHVALSGSKASTAAKAFAVGHGLNLAMKDKGWIKYNFRFSPQDKKKIDRWSNVIESSRRVASHVLSSRPNDRASLVRNLNALKDADASHKAIIAELMDV